MRNFYEKQQAPKEKHLETNDGKQNSLTHGCKTQIYTRRISNQVPFLTNDIFLILYSDTVECCIDKRKFRIISSKQAKWVGIITKQDTGETE